MLLESIRIEYGFPVRLRYHHDRMVHAARALSLPEISFECLESRVGDALSGVPPVGRYKLRLVYAKRLRSIEVTRYFPRVFRRAAIFLAGDLDYSHKFADRHELDAYQARVGASTLAFFVRDGLLTDAWHANLLLRKNGQWYTPRLPLLPGVMRRSLIESKRVIPSDIESRDLCSFESVSPVNAMLEPGEITIPGDQIFFMPR